MFLDDQFFGEKKSRKKEGEAGCLGGTRGAGKGRFGRDNGREGTGLARPCPPSYLGMGGRIVYASRIPLRPHEA